MRARAPAAGTAPGASRVLETVDGDVEVAGPGRLADGVQALGRRAPRPRPEARRWPPGASSSSPEVMTRAMTPTTATTTAILAHCGSAPERLGRRGDPPTAPRRAGWPGRPGKRVDRGDPVLVDDVLGPAVAVPVPAGEAARRVDLPARPPWGPHLVSHVVPSLRSASASPPGWALRDSNLDSYLCTGRSLNGVLTSIFAGRETTRGAMYEGVTQPDVRQPSPSISQSETHAFTNTSGTRRSGRSVRSVFHAAAPHRSPACRTAETACGHQR